MPTDSPNPVASEMQPVNIGHGEEIERFGYSFLLVGTMLPMAIALLMLIYGRCQNDNVLQRKLCEAPPFGDEAQNIISSIAGSALLFEAISNALKYMLNERSYKSQTATPSTIQTGLALAPEHSLTPIPPPVSSFKLMFHLIAPYIVGTFDNLFFTFVSVIPILEKHASIFKESRKNSHVLDFQVTTYDLQYINKFLNKIFTAILFINSFSQLSGLNYYTKLLVLVGLVGYVFFRQLISIQSGRLIRQQLELRKSLLLLKTFIENLPPSTTETREKEPLAEKLKIVSTSFKIRTPFIRIQELENILGELDILLSERSDEKNTIDKNDSTTIINKLLFRQINAPLTTTTTHARRFFQSHLPRQPSAVSHSNAVSMGLIILNLFLPNLISNNSPTTAAAIVSAVLLSTATFMPLNGLTDWENNLWGFNQLIRGNGQEITCQKSLMNFLVINLPKLQGFSGSMEGVGISVGNTQIALVCEGINMFLTFLRSAITLYASCSTACEPNAAPLAQLNNLM